MNILFLTVSTGGGHLRAAEAIDEAVHECFPQANTQIIDTMKYINPMADRLIVGGYLSTVKNTPAIYGMLYSLSEYDNKIHRICSGINGLLSFKITKLIEEYEPSAIVCTHIIPLQMLANLKRKGKANAPVIAVVTDYTGHSFWIHDSIDAYVVPHHEVKSELVRRGIPQDIVYAYGIPVSKCFLQRKNKADLMAEFGLDEKPTILIMGGSLGFGRLDYVFRSLIRSEKEYQIIVVAGHNSKLKKQLEAYTLDTKRKVRIFSYTDRISDLMDISDLIITKPGGMTTTEALIKGLPIFVTSPIPGQEERNAQFLINNGAAASIADFDDPDSIVNQLFNNPVRLGHMKNMAGLLALPNSSKDIAGLLEKLAGKKARHSI